MPEVVVWRLGALQREVGVQLEQWVGREVALVLLPEAGAPIYLPQRAAVDLGRAYGSMLAAAGWATAVMPTG